MTLRFTENDLILDHDELLPDKPDLTKLYSYLAGEEFQELSGAVQVSGVQVKGTTVKVSD